MGNHAELLGQTPRKAIEQFGIVLCTGLACPSMDVGGTVLLLVPLCYSELFVAVWDGALDGLNGSKQAMSS